MENISNYRNTKILVTMGPSIEKDFSKVVDIIDGVRFNMSHASQTEILKFLDVLNEKNIAKLMDLKGNKIRIKEVNKPELFENDTRITSYNVCYTKLLRLQIEGLNNTTESRA